jgi:hypothetical protein
LVGGRLRVVNNFRSSWNYAEFPPATKGVTMPFDIDRFATSLRDKAHKVGFGNGECAKFVRIALEAGGADTRGHLVARRTDLSFRKTHFVNSTWTLQKPSASLEVTLS